MAKCTAKKVKGFTLLEMIVVMAIIGVLASIIIPNTVSQMRDSRIESANAKAKQVYTAVQNYCIDMQIRKVPLTADAGKPAAFPYTTPTGSDKKILIQFVGAKSSDYSKATNLISADHKGAQKENGAVTGNVNPDLTWGFNSISCNGATYTDAVSGANRGTRCVTGISNYLGSSFGATQVGCFTAQINVETYTVECVVYSDEATAVTDVNSVFSGDGSSSAGRGPFTQIFGAVAGSGRSQEADTISRVAPYVGQYPI